MAESTGVELCIAVAMVAVEEHSFADSGHLHIVLSEVPVQSSTVQSALLVVVEMTDQQCNVAAEVEVDVAVVPSTVVVAAVGPEKFDRPRVGVFGSAWRTGPRTLPCCADVAIGLGAVLRELGETGSALVAA